MTGHEPTIWQISGGPSSRTYADVFITYGVGLIGPGDAGPWSAQRSDADFVDEQGASGGFVRRFASEMEIGDVVLLRTGITTIAAVGIVASEYMYLDQFDDVNGWDLQHSRRIRWCKLPQEYDFGSSVFGANPSRCSRAFNTDVTDYAKRFVNSPPTVWKQTLLPELPAGEQELQEIPRYLQAIVGELHDIYPMLMDSERFGELPTEDELVAHFVIPLLRAFGWPSERIAVKWRHIDVAVFDALPRIPEHCRFVIEAKRLGSGVEGALKQAKGYVRSQDIACDIIVTDGIRYRMYAAKNDYEPCAYANLVRLKTPALRLFEIMKRT